MIGCHFLRNETEQGQCSPNTLYQHFRTPSSIPAQAARCEHTQSPKSFHCQGWATLPSSPWGNALQMLCYRFPPRAAPSAPARHSPWYASLLSTSTPWSQSPAGNRDKCLTRLNLVKPTARKRLKNPKLIQEPQFNHTVCPKLCYRTMTWATFLPKCIKKKEMLYFSSVKISLRSGNHML